MTQEDQYITIVLSNGDVHIALGGPSLIYDMLVHGDEVICGESRTSRVFARA
jgi:hypothetical protein